MFHWILAAVFMTQQLKAMVHFHDISQQVFPNFLLRDAPWVSCGFQVAISLCVICAAYEVNVTWKQKLTESGAPMHLYTL